MMTKTSTRATPQDETAKLVRRLRDAGHSYEEIGDWLGIHWRTVYRWGKEETYPWQSVAVNQILAHMLAKGKE